MAVRGFNSRSDIQRRSRVRVQRHLFPVLRLAVATCVSATFVGDTFKPIFLADVDDVLDFLIGGLVRKISHFFEFTAQRIFPTWSIDVLIKKIRCITILGNDLQVLNDAVMLRVRCDENRDRSR